MKKVLILLILIGFAISGVAQADQIQDTATELVLVLYDNPSDELVAKEIADARKRVKRRYKDDKNVELVVDTEGYTVREKLKDPSDKHVLKRLRKKLKSVKRSIEAQI